MERTSTVDITPYNFKHLPLSGFFLILGKRGTGKSTYASYVLQFSPVKSTGLFCVMCGSVSVKQAWAPIIPKLFLIDPSVAYLHSLRVQQEAHISKYGEHGLPDRYKVTLVLDDVASSKLIMRSKELQYLASNSRHLGITIVILAQYLYQVTSEVRSQFDLIMCLSTSNLRNITTLHAEFCNSVSIRVFRSVLQAVTDNFGILIVDNTRNGDIEDVCSYARINPYPPVLQKLGAPSAWTFSKNHFCDLDALKQSRTRASEDDIDDDDEDVGGRMSVDNVFMDVVDNTKTYSDRFGKVVVRRIPVDKSKID